MVKVFVCKYNGFALELVGVPRFSDVLIHNGKGWVKTQNPRSIDRAGILSLIQYCIFTHQ